uniref:RNA polymerase sigma-70 domain-containing protein n=1 Tax=Phaeomonas parva TaxID=124430 RepID=A0A7S1TU44_9STRA|mmetsp:Transcript_14805/g.44616  ORF Transcript_14805/g.44616 Transcript_14805/m.44616 type:complete len:513 (+) Transcript_14805:237-1775(+)
MGRRFRIAAIAALIVASCKALYFEKPSARGVQAHTALSMATAGRPRGRSRNGPRADILSSGVQSLGEDAAVPAPNVRSGILQVMEPSDSVSWLLSHISKDRNGKPQKLLTHEQEISLAEQMRNLVDLEAVRSALAETKAALGAKEQDGDAPEIDPQTMVSMDEWADALDMNVAELRRTIANAKQARADMIKSNLALVVSIAKGFRNRGLPLQDLIQEGAVGLAVAAARYDPTRGFRFSTYATYWIRQKITRAVVDSGRVIRLPAHVHELKMRAGREWRNLEEQLGRPPSMEELARELGITSARLATVVVTDHTVFSMDKHLPDAKGTPGMGRSTVGDLLQCESLSPEDTVQRFTLKEVIDTMISRLPQREASVLRMRFGLDDGQPKSVSEVGARHSCTKERVRLIENRALLKLRSRSTRNEMREYNALRELMDEVLMDMEGDDGTVVSESRVPGAHGKGPVPGQADGKTNKTVSYADVFKARRQRASALGADGEKGDHAADAAGATSLRRPQ